MEVDACTITELITIREEDHREKLHRYYRAQLTKLQGKRFITRQMPTNNHIPTCAKTVTAKIARVEAGGYDSLLDDDSKYYYPLAKKSSAKKTEESSDEESEEEEWDCSLGISGNIQTQPF
jgi:hypothetical protein